MKIAQVVCVLPPYGGGLGSVAHNYAAGLSRAGLDCSVIIPDAGLDYQKDKNYRVIALRPWIKIGLGAFMRGALRELRQADIIHFHQPFFGAAWPVLIAKLFRPKKKLIISYHQDLTLSGWRGLYYKLTMHTIFPCLLRLADKIIASSEDYLLGSRLAGYYRRQPGKFAFLAYGAPEEFIPRPKDRQLLAKYGLREDELVAMFVGGMDSAHHYKGVGLLLQALVELPQWQGLLVGSGNLKPGYESQAKESGLSDRVKFAGYVADADLPAHYNLADVLVLPSLSQAESFGIVQIEAMASGVPTIASDLRGVRSVAADGGLVFRTGDRADLHAKLEQMSEAQTRRQFSQKALSSVEQKYRWPRIIEKLIDIYQS